MAHSLKGINISAQGNTLGSEVPRIASDAGVPWVWMMAKAANMLYQLSKKALYCYRTKTS
jgi:hypothetical protein